MTQLVAETGGAGGTPGAADLIGPPGPADQLRGPVTNLGTAGPGTPGTPVAPSLPDSAAAAAAAAEAETDAADQVAELEAGFEEPAARVSLRHLTGELGGLHAAIRRGDPGAAERQHAKGKLTARERIDLLLDPGSFTELQGLRRHRATGFGLEHRRPHADGVITGWGTVFGRTVFVYAADAQVFGGALGEAHAEKIHRLLDTAMATGAPVVAINDGAGARIQEGVTALAGYGGIFRRQVAASGVLPQIAVMLGPSAGGAAYSPALTDFVFAVRGTSQMFITGPDVVAAVTGERVTLEELGGADTHAASGVVGFVYDDEAGCLEDVRYLLSMLPDNNRLTPPAVPSDDPVDRRNDRLLDLVPSDPASAYDMREVIAEIADDGEFLQVHERWAGNVICALARLGGQVVGLVANQPLVLAGVLDIEASQKAARFVAMCDTFNIPLITLVDVPGFLPGVDQEHKGIIRHGAKLLYAYCNATVPRIQLILRKAYGGAYIVMDSRSIGSDLSFAWPTNEIAVMGPEGAASVVFRREIADSADPEATRRARIAEYRERMMHPFHAAERGLVDDVIDPAATRAVLAGAVRMLVGKHAAIPHRKHGNQPT